MSFRNFDNRDRYYDLQGKPLAGCVQFMLKDGNTVAPIFDGDMVPLSNPQLTDILGRTVNQVFIDAEVISYMYKYVGRGTLAEEEALGIDTSDESKWSLQYTVESAAIDTRSIEGTSAAGVPDIDTLRELDVAEVPEIYGHKIVTLHGYYEAGDCEAVNYIWDNDSTLNDDNGSVIAPNNRLTGRWILVRPTEHCDSRHFGVFPQDSVDADIDHSTRITQLISYCNTCSIKPYFNGSQAYPYFIYNSIAYNSRNTIDVSDDTKFVDKGTGNRFYGEWNGNPYFVNANTKLNSKFVRHSWHIGSYDSDGTVQYIVDSTWSPVFLSNIEAVLEISPASSSQFNDCEMTSNEKITNSVVLENMTIHTDWFADNYNWGNLSMYNCNIILQNCKDANTYVLLKNKQNEADYGDLGEQTLSNTQLLPNAIAENAAFNNVTLVGDTELHNISGTVMLSGSAYNLNFVDCWLTITNSSQIVMDNIAWRRGSVTATAQIQPLTSLMLDNVEVNAPFYSIGVEAQMYGCSIRTTQHLFRDVQIIDCRIFSAIRQYPQYKMPSHGYDGYYWCGMYSGNTFIGENAKIMLAPIPGVDYSSLHLGLETKICNNVSDHNFVDDTLWQGVTKAGWSSTQDFRYEGNKGGCPVFEDEITYTMPYIYTGWVDDRTSFCSNVPGTTDSTGCWIVRDGRSASGNNVAYDVYWVLNFKDVPLPVEKLFRLPNLRGRQSLLVQAFVQVFLRPDNNSDWPFYMQEFNIDTPMLTTAVDGNVNMAYASSYRPMKYHFAGIRYCDNAGIDNWRSSMTAALYDYRDAGGSFAGSVKYRYSFNDFGKTTEPGI